MVRGTCICGNTSGYDEESLKASTININGTDIVLDCHCEDELLVKLAARKGLKIVLNEDYEIVSAVMEK